MIIRQPQVPFSSLFVGPQGTIATKFPNNNPQTAVYCNPSYGPTFGAGHDLYICDNSNMEATSYSNLGYSYQDSLGYGGLAVKLRLYTKFQVNEIEVYHLQ